MPPRGDSTLAARITVPFAKRGENLSRAEMLDLVADDDPCAR